MTVLHELARHHGVLLSYHDIRGQVRYASPDALLAVLRALGEPITDVKDAVEALRARQAAQAQQGSEPVVVAWEGQAASLALHAPEALGERALRCELAMEDGQRRDWTASAVRTGHASALLPLPGGLPLGYHRLAIEAGGRRHEALVIAAPRKAWSPADGSHGKLWGVFLPLYALRSQASLASGDFADLATLTRWVSGLGGHVVATLPLLAVLLDEPFEPSPYAPASRLFWNAFFVNLTRVDEFSAPSVQALVRSAPLAAELSSLRADSLVDYRREMAAKRRILREMATVLEASSSARRRAVEAWRQAHPEVEVFARFMAVCERRRAAWRVWPEAMRAGRLSDADGEAEAVREHVYAQYLAQEQLAALSQQARQHGPGLYLDLPLGVHPDGFDVWRHQSLFALEASGGAPPDDFFSKGQDWGFPPMRPQALRAQGYQYYLACLRHHLRSAGMLRIDHVMGLHRMFWVPRGCSATDGVYVRYPAEELYAILALESQRHRALIVGEDLGTVPEDVRPAMAEHGLLRMSVGQFEITPDPQCAIRPIPAEAVVCLTTHDTPTFAAVWEGRDMQERMQRGLLSEEQAARERVHRERLRQALMAFLRCAETPAILKAILLHLARSDAGVLLVSLEDLWLEMEPQNRPGTWREFPNWRRKARKTFEQFSSDSIVLDVLRSIAQIRR